MSLAHISCYGVRVPACYHHVNMNIIYDWSCRSHTNQVPHFIRDYLDIFETCYHHGGMKSRLALAVSAELYSHKNVDISGDLLDEYFRVTLTKKTGDIDCPICMEPSDTIMETRCGHSFCKDCISSWCMMGHPSCPLCRHDI